MHNSAYRNAQEFFEKYCKDNIKQQTVLDVGSYDVNGSLKPIFKDAKKYTGLDQCEGKNVDVVGSSHDIPFPDKTFDIVISSSCFEHDSMFWLSFIEICRVVKPSGLIYIQAPSDGPYHAFPVDNWRFYKDAWKALEQWAVKNNYDMKLLNGFVDEKSDGLWHDSIGIYTRIS